ncbi:MAG: hypothetical protein ACLRVD_01670 [Blautia caecimuris]
MSGYIASDMTLVADMITEYMHRDDMPTIVLSAHSDLFKILRQRLRTGEIDRVMISDPFDRNYHPFLRNEHSETTSLYSYICGGAGIPYNN